MILKIKGNAKAHFYCALKSELKTEIYFLPPYQNRPISTLLPVWKWLGNK